MNTKKIKKDTFTLKNICIALSIMFLFMLIQTCNINSKIKRVKRQNDTLKTLVIDLKKEIKVIENKTIEKSYLDYVLEINRLETMRDMLYDQNTIVRGIYRPDDRMRYYQIKIDSTRNKSLNTKK